MPLVKVTWHDAADEEKTWLKESEIDAFGDEPVEVVSIGWLLRKTPKYVTLAGDRIEEGTEEVTWGRVCKIPLGMVQSIEDLTDSSAPQRDTPER